MITPSFTVAQNEEFVLIDIKIKHVRFSAANIEMVVEDNVFIFSLSPYYLRLRFPKSMMDDERSSAKLNSATEEINIQIPKLNKGEVFEDLDLSAKLLARSNELIDPKLEEPLMTEISTTAPGHVPAQSASDPANASPQQRPLIQELDVDHNLEKDINQAEDFNWEIEQNSAPVQDTDVTMTKVKYGFNDLYDTIVGISIANGNDINELSDPERTNPDQRILERLIKENIKFDHEYYAADYIMEKYPAEDDDKRFGDLLAWKNPLTQFFIKFNKKQQLLKKNGEDVEAFPPIEFTKEEQEQMLNLPKRTYLVDKAIYLHYTILSVLFSYCFDLRENEGDKTTESAWTVGKLTPQIAMLDQQIISSESTETNLLKSVVITSTRRALSYPLHRNFNLVMKTWEDVYHALRCGKRYVLRLLLAIRELFRYHDVYYVYCKILLDDLTSWFINDVGDNLLRSMAHELRKTTSTLAKSDITFEKVIVEDENKVEEMVVLDLAEIEEMANEMYAEQMEH